MRLIWQMETKAVFLEGYFHCYMEDDKIRQEITKVSDTKEEIAVWCTGREGTLRRCPTQIMAGGGSSSFVSFLSITPDTNTRCHMP